MTEARSFTLRRAIVLTVVLGLLAPALLISGYSWYRQYTEGIRLQTREMLEQNADILANGMQEALWNINEESGNALVEAMMLRHEDIVGIQVRDNALGLFVSGDRQLRDRAAISAIEKPVVYRGATIGSVKVEISSERLRNNVIRDVQESIVSVLAQAALSIALILILLEQRLVRPLQKLGSGATRLANRELEVPFTWQRLDEIGMLGRRLEDTRISLRRLFEELDHKNRELELDIDKRKRVEQELHAREERYRALVEQSPIAIIEWDSNFRVVEWNAAAEQIFGYPREQVMGRHAGFVAAEGEHEAAEARFRALLQQRAGSRNVVRNRRADGRTIICQWSHAWIDGEDGRPERLVSSAEDITEKRRAEEALSLSEAKFASAFHSNPDSISLSRLDDSVLIDVNQTFERLTGFSREEAVGKTAFELRLWADPPRRRELVQRLEISGMVRNHEWAMRTKHGSTRLCMTNATVFSVGADRYVLIVNRDVTDQRLLEEQKAEADRALLRLAQGTRDMAGESFFELLVADLASALHTDCAFIGLRTAAHQSTVATIAAHRNGAGIPNFEFDSRDTPCERTLSGEVYVLPADARPAFSGSGRGQTRWESYAGAPLRDTAGNTIGVLAVMHFASLGNPDLVRSLLQVFSERAAAELERKRAEEELRILNSQLEQRVVLRTEELQHANQELASTLETLHKAQEELVRSEKLAALGALVAGIAHELNTPIGNSLMVASTLADQTRALTGHYRDNTLRRSLLERYIGDAGTAGDILMRNLHRAADLVTSFKQVAVDQTSSQRRSFSVAEVVAEIMLTLWPTLKKTAFTVQQEIAEGLRMDSYPGPLGQVITNLVNNALLHGFEGRDAGTVIISATPAAEGWMELTVRDDGAGIPAANLNRIFDPFFTTRLGAGGSGLGMNITHNIVTGVLGGRIRVQSEPGKGAAFILSLPISAPSRQTEEEALRQPVPLE